MRLRSFLTPIYRPIATAARMNVSVCDARSPLNKDVIVLKISMICQSLIFASLLSLKFALRAVLTTSSYTGFIRVYAIA